MFGIDDALIWGPMLGAALGGVASKKDPLTGALVGAGVGLGGAGLLGGGAAASAPGMGGALGGGLSSSAMPGLSAASSTGLTGALPLNPSLAATATGLASSLAAAPSFLDKTLATVKPIGQAMSTANQVKSMFEEPQQQIQASPVMQNQPNNQLGQLVSNFDTQQQQQQQNDQQKRQLRQQIIKGLL